MIYLPFIDKLLNATYYDKRQRPGTEDQPTLVSFSIYVINIPELNFNRHNGEMTLEMYFRQIWTDDRLKFHASFLHSLCFYICIELV